MGLDMYLKRTKKVSGWKAEDYEQAEDTVSGEIFKKPEGAIPVTILNASTGEAKLYDPPVGTLERARLLAPLEVRESVQVRGEDFKYFSIYEEVGYWRKANAVHKWFVDYVQGGVDECQTFFITKYHLTALREACVKALGGDTKALPTQGGFFFGSTDYDEWYRQGLFETIEICTRVLRETNWDEQVVFYQSSW